MKCCICHQNKSFIWAIKNSLHMRLCEECTYNLATEAVDEE
jgi:hypothetical protein